MSSSCRSPGALRRPRPWHAALVLLGTLPILALGCGRSKDLEKDLKKKAEEREEKAKGEVGKLITKYAEGLLADLPSAGVKGQLGAEHPMVAWRRAAADNKLALIAKERAEVLKDTPAAKQLQDAELLFKAVKEYWLGKDLKGPKLKKEWEEGYAESAKVAAKKDSKERIPLPKHLAKLASLGREAPLDEIAEFEALLPHVLHVYQFRAYRGHVNMTFTRYWQVMFDLPRKKEGDGLESYQPYRDRLCKERRGKRCEVAYEHRGMVVRRAYLEKIVEKLDAFEKKHAQSALLPLVQRFRTDSKKEVDLAIVPPEYPVLPDTPALIPSSVYTVLVAGPKGITLETDDPADRKNRRVVKLLDEGEDLAMDAETAAPVLEKFTEAMKKLGADGAGPDYTSEIFIHFDKAVPVALLEQFSTTFKPIGMKLIDFVGRLRSDGSMRVRRLAGNVIDQESRGALKFNAGGSAWNCRPLASLGSYKAVPSAAKHILLATGTKVIGASKKGGAPAVTGELSGDMSKVGEWVRGQKRVLVGLKGELTYEQLHKVLGLLVPPTCKDALCVDEAMTGRSVAICD